MSAPMGVEGGMTEDVMEDKERADIAEEAHLQAEEEVGEGHASGKAAGG